jgi:peptide deformylase
MLKIVTTPSTVLTTPSQPVASFDAKLTSLIKQMEETLVAQVDPQGVGLAAPHVGINLQVFIMKPDEDAELEACINPKILEQIERKPAPVTEKKKRKKKDNKLEGCLSIPRIWGTVKRPDKVLLQYQTPDGTVKKEWYSGLKAIIVQHEVDHLHGVLFTQRALEQGSPLYEEKDDEFVKIDSSL